MNTPATPKLIAVDCDGTFFDGSGHPAPQSCEVMQRLQGAGHHIVACTGRSRFSAEARLTCVPAMRYLVCSNGAYVWDTQEQTLVSESAMSSHLVASVADKLRAAFDDVAFNWETSTGIRTDDEFCRLAGGVKELEVGGQAGELGTQAIYKLKVRRPNVSPADLYQEQLSILGPDLCEITVSGAPFTELGAQGVTKAVGLESIATQLGFTAADTIVFGDNQNDMPMFEWAGQAIAMDNATDELKAIANAITLSNREHGVAHYLTQQMDAGFL